MLVLYNTFEGVKKDIIEINSIINRFITKYIYWKP